MTAHDASHARARGTRWGAPNTNGDVTETTGLLNSVTDELHPEAGRDVWVGAEDFEGFPWWRRPSVCFRLSGFPTAAVRRRKLFGVDGRCCI